MFDSDDDAKARRIPRVLSDILRASDSILDMLPIATFICDARGTILQYNRRAVEIWGRAPRPGQSHSDFRARSFDLDGAGRAFDDFQGAGDGHAGARCRTHHRAGRRFLVIVSVNVDPLRDAKGKVVGAVNCFLDITERKRMDDELKHSRQLTLEQEQRLAATYEHAAIGISEVAPDGSFLRVNEAICAITGYSRDELWRPRFSAIRIRKMSIRTAKATASGSAGDLDFYSVEKLLSARMAA